MSSVTERTVTGQSKENYPDLSDRELLTLIQQNNPDAFEAFYDRHVQITNNLAARILRDSDLISEVVQETFWQVWKKASDYRGMGSVQAWLYRIARNKCIDIIRKQRRSPATDQADSLHTGPYDEITTPHPTETSHGALAYSHSSVEREVAQIMNQVQLQQALSIIPNEQRICLELAYYQGMSHREIAEKIGQPIGTVKTRIRIGLGKLEYILRAAGYREDELLP